MKSLTKGYEYPPSSNILRYGAIEDGSHYFAEGYAFFKDKRIRKRKCRFEVAYTHECDVIVVCYFETDFHESEKWFNSCYKVIGREIREGLSIGIDIATSRRWSRTTIGANDLTMIYGASCYKIILPYQKQIPEEHKHLPHFEITSIQFPYWLDSTHPYFDKRRKARVNFLLSKKAKLTLLFRRSADKREYDNQPTARLAIRPECIPDEWDAVNVADTWCALMSIALGQDIQWTSWFVPLDHRTNLEKTWQTAHIKGKASIHSCIVRGLHTLDEIHTLQKFIRQTFKGIVTNHISDSEAHNYAYLIRNFIDYSTTSTASGEGKMRLITTLVEEFLDIWEQHKNINPIPLMTGAERKKLESILRQTMQENSDSFLDEDHKANLPEIIEKTINLVQREIRDISLVERLKFFFNTNKHLTPDDSTLLLRIKAFSQTRNSVAHTGRLATYNPKVKLITFCDAEEHKLQHEYDNVLIMIPLMTFCVFFYKGNFHDLVYRRQEQVW